MHVQDKTSVFIFSLLLQTLHPPLKQFTQSTAVPKINLKIPLYPVAIILLSLTMMAPTAYLRQPERSFSTLQIEIKYSSKFGR